MILRTVYWEQLCGYVYKSSKRYLENWESIKFRNLKNILYKDFLFNSLLHPIYYAKDLNFIPKSHMIWNVWLIIIYDYYLATETFYSLLFRDGGVFAIWITTKNVMS